MGDGVSLMQDGVSFLVDGGGAFFFDFLFDISLHSSSIVHGS